MSNKEITAALVAEIRPQSNPGLQVQMTPTPATTAVGLQGSVVTGSAQALWIILTIMITHTRQRRSKLGQFPSVYRML